MHRDGAVRSSGEALVMRVERRGCIIQWEIFHQPEMGGVIWILQEVETFTLENKTMVWENCKAIP